MPADTFTTDGIGVLLMGTGNDNNIWGTNANTSVFQVFADAVANALVSTVTGGTLDLSGSPPPAATSQAHYATLVFNGVLASAQSIKVPNLSKYWWVINQTTGAFALTMKTPSGAASVSIPQNSGIQLVYCDGSNNIVVSPFNAVQVQMSDGTAGAPSYSDINETNSGWYRNGTQDWRLAINGSDVLQVTGTGAATTSVFNVLSPNVVQQQGVQIVPPGVEVDYAGITAPTGWYMAYGQTLTRATDLPLFNAITATATGNTHSNTTIDGLSTDLRGLGLVGAFIEGTGVNTGTTIISINSATSLTVSGAVSSTNTGVALRIIPYGQGDGATTFALPDRRGRIVAARDDMGGTAANRLTAGGSGIVGTELLATGGAETVTLTASTIPAHTHSGTTATATPAITTSMRISNAALGAGSVNYATDTTNQEGTTTASSTQPAHSHTFTTDSGTGGGLAHQNTQPTSIANKIIKR